MSWLKAATHTMWAIGLFFSIGIFFWFIPRDVIDIDIVTDRDSYRIGEEVTTINTFTTYGSAQSSYVSRLVCRNGIERRYILFTVESQSTERQTSNSTAVYPIPEFVHPEAKCVIQITSAHRVQVLPFLSKTVFDEFESNEFKVTQ